MAKRDNGSSVATLPGELPTPRSSAHDPECVLCNISSNRLVTPFVELFARSRGTADQIMARSSSVFVCVDSAPIAPGHCMVVTERHVPSFAAASPIEQEEAKSFARQIRHELSSSSDVCLFEHGPSADLTITAGCGINHAHLHALPIASRHFEPLLREYEFQAIDDLTTIGEIVGKDAYLYVETLDLGPLVTLVNDGASQTIRRALASSIGQPCVANWQDQHYFAEEFGTRAAVEASLEMLRGLEAPRTTVTSHIDGG